MRTPRRKSLALAATVGAALTLLTPTAALAAYYGDETNYAVSSSGPTGTEDVSYFCTLHTGVKACFAPHGDYLYVKDTKADDYAAVVEWTIGSRNGSCVNKLQAGDWGVCNKDFNEDESISFKAARYNSGNFVDRNPVPTTVLNNF